MIFFYGFRIMLNRVNCKTWKSFNSCSTEH